MRSSCPSGPVLALDLGGTKMLAAVVAPDGRILAQKRSLTPAEQGPSVVINHIFALLDGLLREVNLKSKQVSAISIAAAGGIDSAAGVVTFSPNLPGWRDIPLRQMVQDRFGMPVFLVNDASAAALGEHRFGVGRGAKNLVMITVGTGIGGGIIINNELYLGSKGSAGEIGHMTVEAGGPECPCGNTGCLEMLASGSAMAREAKARLGKGEASSLQGQDVTAEKIGIAARNGDELSMAVISRAALYLGVGMVNLVNLFNPEMIIVGGGVANLGDLLLAPARQLVQERAFPIAARAVQVVRAGLGNEAGVCGAAAWAQDGGAAFVDS